MIIAIDGPAASGKGTLAKRLAGFFRLPHLDSGLLYRAIARSLMDAQTPLDDAGEAVKAAQSLNIRDIDEDRLRGAAMGDAASIVAAIPDVRAALIDAQRRFANQPGGAVLDGRDIGTVIAPHADVKIFVTASAEARALRRFKEAEARGEETTLDAILADILKRDARDANRAAAPLKPAVDAAMLDTSDLSIEEAFDAAIGIVRSKAPEAAARASA